MFRRSLGDGNARQASRLAPDGGRPCRDRPSPDFAPAVVVAAARCCGSRRGADSHRQWCFARLALRQNVRRRNRLDRASAPTHSWIRYTVTAILTAIPCTGIPLSPEFPEFLSPEFKRLYAPWIPVGEALGNTKGIGRIAITKIWANSGEIFAAQIYPVFGAIGLMRRNRNAVHLNFNDERFHLATNPHRIVVEGRKFPKLLIVMRRIYERIHATPYSDEWVFLWSRCPDRQSHCHQD